MYYLKRILHALLNVFIITSFSFFLISLIPGDIATTILGADAPIEQIELFRANFGLDKPLFIRYIDWFRGIFRGDFGISLKYGIPVKDLVYNSLKITFEIAIISICIIFIVSVILSFYTNQIKNRYISRFFDILLGIGIAIPSFWLSIISIFLFSVILRWFNIGYNGTLVSLIIPCLIISIPQISSITLNMKENIYYETRKDYIKFLYSNGMNIKYLNMYILKNSIITIIPLLGLVVLDIITGIVIVEQIFSIPGIGRLLLVSVYSRDIPLLQALIVYTSIAVILLNILIDIIYSILDKRIRHGR